MNIYSAYKQWFGNLLIRKKIIYIYIPLIVVPLLLLGLISNYIFTQAIIQKTKKSIIDNSVLIVTRVNTMMTNTENCANIVTLNLIKVLQANQNNAQNQISYLKMRGEIQNELSLIQLTFPDVESAAFIDVDSNIFCTTDSMGDNLSKALESGIFNDINNRGAQNIWLPMQIRDFLVTDKNSPVVTLGKKVINPGTGSTFGILVLNIKEKSISGIYNSIGPAKIKSFFIIDGQGEVISSQNKEDILKPLANHVLAQLILSGETLSEIKRINGKSMLITSIPAQYMGWKLVSTIPIEELTEDIRKNTVIVVALSFLFIILAVFGSMLLSSVIAKPLVKLTRKMDEIKKDDLDRGYSVNTTDEIGKLASGFNTMLERIKELLQKSRLEQKKLREYELSLIQAQIKPHFLYNSLELIYVLCGMAGAKDAQIATKSLADFYRAVLSKGKEIISIGDEIKNVSDYLYIQRSRYMDVFDYEIKLPEEILNNKILKLTLQPLVENSIYHALKVKGSFGRILIEGSVAGENILIKVIDDGVGMTDEKIKEIFSDSGNNPANQSFGLRSVDERIKLFFGDAYGLWIDSEPGRGTTITVVIPA